MQVVTVSNQKGGVGKSTIAVHLALAMVNNNKKVCVIDLDPQGNSSKTLSKMIPPSPLVSGDLFQKHPIDGSKIGLHSRETANDEGQLAIVCADPSMVDIERAESNVLKFFLNNIAQMDEHFDYVVIDTPPTLGIRMTASLVVADHVLAPIELEEYSIDGITKMLQTVFGVKEKWNEDLNFLGMLPNRFNPRSQAQKETLLALIDKYPHLLINAKIGIRSSIPEALNEGIPVWELKKSAAREAAKEFESAFKIIFKKMESEDE